MRVEEVRGLLEAVGLSRGVFFFLKEEVEVEIEEMSKLILFSILGLFFSSFFSLATLTRLVNLSSTASTLLASSEEEEARARERSSSRALLLLLAFDVDGFSSTTEASTPPLLFKLVAAAAAF